VQVSSQTSDFTQGDVSATGVDTDVAINGNGFFVVEENGVQSYTRAGNFEIGTNNLLETAGGQTVMGYPATNGVVNTSAGLSTLELGAGTSSPATATANLQMTTNLNATGAWARTYSTTATIYDSLGAPHQLTVDVHEHGRQHVELPAFHSVRRPQSNGFRDASGVDSADRNPANGHVDVRREWESDLGHAGYWSRSDAAD